MNQLVRAFVFLAAWVALAGCAPVHTYTPGTSELSIVNALTELFGAYQKSSGPRLSRAEIERNTERAMPSFQGVLNRAVTLEKRGRDVRKIEAGSRRLAGRIVSNADPSEKKSFSYWTAGEVVKGRPVDRFDWLVALAILEEAERSR